MLTIELKKPENSGENFAEIEIYCDAKGVEELMKHLKHLAGGESHVHLMTESWAGNELDEVAFEKNAVIIHHLKIVHIGENHPLPEDTEN